MQKRVRCLPRCLTWSFGLVWAVGKTLGVAQGGRGVRVLRSSHAARNGSRRRDAMQELRRGNSDCTLLLRNGEPFKAYDMV
eukprot:6172994-Pleurochrysis_carterae.AAC.4